MEPTQTWTKRYAAIVSTITRNKLSQLQCTLLNIFQKSSFTLRTVDGLGCERRMVTKGSSNPNLFLFSSLNGCILITKDTFSSYCEHLDLVIQLFTIVSTVQSNKLVLLTCVALRNPFFTFVLYQRLVTLSFGEKICTTIALFFKFNRVHPSFFLLFVFVKQGLNRGSNRALLSVFDCVWMEVIGVILKVTFKKVS